MLCLHIYTNAGKAKEKTLAVLDAKIKEEVQYRNTEYKKEQCEKRDAEKLLNNDLRSFYKLQEDFNRNLRDLSSGLKLLSTSLSPYQDETIKHPKEVIKKIKHSIKQKLTTDHILTFDPIIYKLIETYHIDDKRVSIYINGVNHNSSSHTIGKALNICTREFYNLYMLNPVDAKKIVKMQELAD